MPTPAFFAVLRNASKLAAAAADDLAAQGAKIAAATDDVAILAAKAGVKTSGVAGDDLAVGAGQISGISPNRELATLWRITKGSARNKIWLGALLLIAGHLLPDAITVALVIGGLYLAYEGGAGLLSMLHPSPDTVIEPPMSEDEKVRGAINTDRILSLEMGIISLAAIGDVSLSYKIAVLILVGFVMAVGVYGLIAVIIRLDDMGLALARADNGFKKKLGYRMANAAPIILKILGPLGMVAMIAVAGGIITHIFHIEFPHWTIGLLGDIACGTIVGLILAGGQHLLLKIKNSFTAGT